MTFNATPVDGEFKVVGRNKYQYDAASSTWINREPITQTMMQKNRPGNARDGDLWVNTNHEEWPPLWMKDGAGWSRVNSALLRIGSEFKTGINAYNAHGLKFYRYVEWNGTFRRTERVDAKFTTSNGSNIVSLKNYREWFSGASGSQGAQETWTSLNSANRNIVLFNDLPTRFATASPMQFRMIIVNSRQRMPTTMLIVTNGLNNNGDLIEETHHIECEGGGSMLDRIDLYTPAKSEYSGEIYGVRW